VDAEVTADGGFAQIKDEDLTPGFEVFYRIDIRELPP
jgi:hypothetical protein